MEQELDWRQDNVTLRRVDDTLSTMLEGGLEQWDDIGGLVLQALCEAVTEGLQMIEADVAIVQFGFDILIKLVSIIWVSWGEAVGGQAKAGHL
jgi:hypothetical protein